MDDDEQISPVDHMVFKARKAFLGGEQAPPSLKMVSFRLPLHLLASVDALASITAQSRNTTMIDLLDAGVYAVSNALDDPEQFHEARQHFLTQLTGE